MNSTVDQTSIIFNRMLFHTKYQEENESVADFATTLKNLLRVCQYAADCIFLDGLARDRFIAGVADKELQVFLTTQPENISLDEIVALCLKLQCPLNKDENPDTVQVLSDKYSNDQYDLLPSVQSTNNVLDIRLEKEVDEKGYGSTKSFNDEELSIQNRNTHK